MAFEFQQYHNPYAGTIAELMGVPAAVRAQADQTKAAAWGTATRDIGNDVAGAIQTATDPQRQLAQQQVDANKRSVAYQTTATKIAQSLTGPNGEQPTPDMASQMMTRAGIPVTSQKPILDSLQSMLDHKNESLADAGHMAYRVMDTLPTTATDDDRAHAASAALGASMAAGVTSQAQADQVTQALGNGANPRAMALAFMGKSPSGKYKDIIQDASKPIALPPTPAGGSPGRVVSPSGNTIAIGGDAPPKPMTREQVLIDAAKFGTSNETPTSKSSKDALDLEQQQKNPPTLEEQYLKAVAGGDKTAADNIAKTWQDKARASRDPEAAAQLAAIRTLSQQAAQARLDDMDPQSAKSQQKFEQEYRNVLQRGLSNRSGGLGLEDTKVQQANHLLSIFDQNYNAKDGTWNIPRVQLNELALGLARLTSPGGQAGEGMLKEFQQRTAKGDLAGFLTYVTGEPVPANTQDITKMLKDSIERQGSTALQNREGEMAYLRGLAPTDLSEDRRKTLEATSLNPLRQSRVAVDSSGNKKVFVSLDGGQTWK